MEKNEKNFENRMMEGRDKNDVMENDRIIVKNGEIG